MLTSALKRVNVAVEDITRQASQGKFKPKADYQYSLKNNGVGLGSVNSRVKKSFVARTVAIGKLIGSGKIKVRPIIKFKASN